MKLYHHQCDKFYLIHGTEIHLKKISLVCTILLGKQRCCAGWVASVPQLVSSARNPPGQHWGIQEGNEHCTTQWLTVFTFHSVHRSLLSGINSLFNLVSAGCRDIVRISEETQFHSRPQVSGQQEQPWGPAGAWGRTFLMSWFSCS